MVLSESLSYKMPLEVYLQSAVVRGILVTSQDRLSNHFVALQQGEEVFSLRNPVLESGDHKLAAAVSDEFLIYMQQVLLIADLSSQPQSDRSAVGPSYVKKEASRALLGIGPYWIEGNLHVAPGGALHDLLVAKARFIPVTDAVLLNHSEASGRTYLVNRMKIAFITSLRQSLKGP
jgi:hypothetical protein